MKRLLIAAVLALVLALACAAYADVIRTKDGKTFEGKITEQTDKHVRLRTGYGDLIILRSDIEAIEISLSRVRLKDGRVVKGVITEENRQKVVLRTKYGELAIPRSDIDGIDKPGEYLGARKEAVKPVRKLSGQEKQKLHGEAIQLLQAKKYDEAITIYKKILTDSPLDTLALYNMACVYSLKGRKDAALEHLEKSVKAGFVDFALIERDGDLDNIRNEPRYKSLMARKEEMLLNVAQRRAQQIKKEYGENYIVEIDRERRIIYATDQPRAVLKRLKEVLNSYADAQWETLFDKRPTYYIAVICASEKDYRKVIKNPAIQGMYWNGSKTLLCNGIGSILRHEFTHALHFADMGARGRKEHPIWIKEGLATVFESSALEKGVPVPQPNSRLNDVRRALAAGRYLPWERFFKISQQQFMQKENMETSYSEARYIMYYFHHLGKLKEWYDTYCANFDKDSTGKLAVELTFGKSLTEVQKDFEKWIAKAPGSLGAAPAGSPFFGIGTSSTAVGVQVTHVAPGSPAAEAGIKAGDIIVEFADRRFTNRNALVQAIREQKIGEPVKVVLLRADKEIELELKLKPRK